MPPSEKYIEGQWYGWNGGECPVHPDTDVDVIMKLELENSPVNIQESIPAGVWYWEWDGKTKIIAFRVIKHHIEKKVIWVNEYGDDDFCGAHKTKEEAIKCAGKTATRIAVRYEETPE